MKAMYNDENLIKQIKELNNNGMNANKIAIKLNITRQLVGKINKIHNLNLKRYSTKNQCKGRENDIIMLREKGLSREDISKELNIRYDSLCRYLKSINDNNYNNKKYSYNENIFEKIDSEEKAYWLGFLYADGYVRTSGKGGIVQLSLGEKDLIQLEKFKKFLNSNNEIKKNISILNGKNHVSYKIVISSLKMANDLTSLGCFENKSLDLKFPTEQQVPNEYIHHFMRGYFDGDGCITGIKSKSFSVIGTNAFLKEYQSKLIKELGLNKTKFSKCGQAFTLRYGGNIQIIKIRNFLYKNSSIYLERKHSKFDWRPNSTLQES